MQIGFLLEMHFIWFVTGLVLMLSLTHFGVVPKKFLYSDGIAFDRSRIMKKYGNCRRGYYDNETANCACGITTKPLCIRRPLPLSPECSICYRGNDEEICQFFKDCEKCDKEGCTTCKNNKFGKFCGYTCNCGIGKTCEMDGKCPCLEENVGENCQGCLPPKDYKNELQVVLSPTKAVYSCPERFLLRGSATGTCLSNKTWSSETPRCVPWCPESIPPVNERMNFTSIEVVAGSVMHRYLCNDENPDFDFLFTNGLCSVIECVNQTTKNSSSCPDPSDVQFAQIINEPQELVRTPAGFLQHSKISFKCEPGFEQMGARKLTCLRDGTWSDELPFCIKVSLVKVECHTKGSEIVSDIGIPVRIFCPPECSDGNFRVWGTSIYRQNSSVCLAAIHDSKISNSGGPVNIINIGDYSKFKGSLSNDVESLSYQKRDKSFRLDEVTVQSYSGKARECEKGLIMVNKYCVFLSYNKRVYKDAEAICSNLGLELPTESEYGDILEFSKELGSEKLFDTWTKKRHDNFSGIHNDSSSYHIFGPSKFPGCNAAFNTIDKSKRYVFAYSVHCDDVSLTFICIQKSKASSLVTCDDPGPLENGISRPIGLIEGVFYEGSSVEFSCQSLHFLTGTTVIFCTDTASWSAPKPVCVKVDACEDIPVPIGGFVTYLPPVNTPNEQSISAVYRGGVAVSRLAQFGLSLSSRNQTQSNTTPEPESKSLPLGFHRIGTRAIIGCESRYYKLLGPTTRRCQRKGGWTGRFSICEPVCGQSDSPRAPYIVNGNATDIGQWPWQAGIARHLPDYGRWVILCGASLLNERWVVTAAHCVTYTGTTVVIDPDRFQVYLGKYHREDSKDDEHVQVRKIQEIHIHPDYSPNLYDSDIALLQLDSNVQFSSRTQPVCLPSEKTSRENLVEGKEGVVTGWGMNENETYSDALQQAVLPFVPKDVCEKGYLDAGLPLTVTDNMFCAGYARDTTTACSGDSGGPMVFTDDSSWKRTWVLEGIVSWGSPEGCGNPNQHNGFTKVSKFLDWIHLFI